MHDNMVISFFVAGATVFHYMDYPACMHIRHTLLESVCKNGNK